jgi:uncharacterized protein (DUF488 family)
MTATIYTIGHSDHDWEAFAALLRQTGVQVLVDTRSNPSSGYAPWASSRGLPALLDAQGMRYVFLGDAMGGKPSDPSFYDPKGKPDYRKIRSSPVFQKGLKEVQDLAEDRSVALMCAEEDPSKCHRRLLIEPALLDRGVKVRHIRGDGTVATASTLTSKKAYREQLQGTFPLSD